MIHLSYILALLRDISIEISSTTLGELSGTTLGQFPTGTTLGQFSTGTTLGQLSTGTTRGHLSNLSFPILDLNGKTIINNLGTVSRGINRAVACDTTKSRDCECPHCLALFTWVVYLVPL